MATQAEINNLLANISRVTPQYTEAPKVSRSAQAFASSARQSLGSDIQGLGDFLNKANPFAADPMAYALANPEQQRMLEKNTPDDENIVSSLGKKLQQQNEANKEAMAEHPFATVGGGLVGQVPGIALNGLVAPELAVPKFLGKFSKIAESGLKIATQQGAYDTLTNKGFNPQNIAVAFGLGAGGKALGEGYSGWKALKKIAEKNPELNESNAASLISSNFTEADNLTRATGIPHHLGKTALEETAKGVDVIPEHTANEPQLLQDADNAMIRSHIDLKEHGQAQFDQGLKEELAKQNAPKAYIENPDIVPVDTKPIQQQLQKAVETIKTHDIEMPKDLQLRFERIEKGEPLTYGTLKDLKNSYYQMATDPNVSPLLRRAYGEFHEALKNAEEQALPVLKTIKPQYREGKILLEKIEKLNKQWGKEVDENGQSLMGPAKIKALIRPTAASKLDIIKEVGKYNAAHGLTDPTPSVIKASLKSFFEKGKHEKAQFGQGSLKLNEPGTWLTSAKDLAFGSPERKLRTFAKAAKGMGTEGLAQPANKILGRFLPGASAISGLSKWRLPGIPNMPNVPMDNVLQRTLIQKFMQNDNNRSPQGTRVPMTSLG